MYLRTLGALKLQDAEYARPKALLLLSYLALEGGRDRRHLGTLFFGHAQDVLGSLRITLSRLRRALPGAIDEQNNLLGVHLECDAQVMLTKLDQGDEQAIEFYRGAFLAGVQLPELGVELEEWVYATREYLAGRVRGVLLSMAVRAAALEDFSQASRLAERAAWLEGAADPTPEQFVSLGHLLSAGESPWLDRLRQQARSFDVTVEVSTHEARQALRRSMPADTNRDVRALPLRNTPFVGRGVERAEVVRALSQPDLRLLTLVGPGGIGKTRLALEVAREIQSRGTVAFVSIEAVTSLFPLPGVISAALGVTLQADLPPFEALLQVLKEQTLLLVLDSVEHLLELAPYLSDLLRACPGVTVLVTSRERLGLEEEFVLTLGGLTVPPLGTAIDDLLRAEAVELFVSRASRARLDFELTPDSLLAVREICSLVGGFPLGIELAAAWVRLMSVADIAEEIRRSLDFLEATDTGVTTRHHSVRAVFEQTWARLTETEHTLLMRLSVFRGGFTREAAGQVAGATLLTLAGLVDRSLIRVAEHGRYDIHVLLQGFIREALAQHPAEQQSAIEAHGRHVLAFAEQASAGIRSLLNEKRWVEGLDRDIENIRSALDTWMAHKQKALALVCVNELRNFWIRTGRMREARRWLRFVLEGQELEDKYRRRALALDGELAFDLREYDVAQQQLEASLKLYQKATIPAPLQRLHLGRVTHLLGDLVAARAHYEGALAEFRGLGQINGVAAALNNLGVVLTEAEAYEDALDIFGQALQAKRDSGGDIESVLTYLGTLYLRMNRLDESGVHFAQALKGLEDRGFYIHIPEVLEGLGFVAFMQGQVRDASVLLAAAERQREVQDYQMSPGERAHLESRLAKLSEQLGTEIFAEAWDEGRAMTREQAVVFALRT